MTADIGYLGPIWRNNANVLHFNTPGKQIIHNSTNYLSFCIALLTLDGYLLTALIAYI